MPLSEPTKRQLQHTRHLEILGYHRADGLLDIEGHLIDTKPFDLPNKDRGGQIHAGESLHEMRVRLTLDLEFNIIDAEAVTEWAPFKHCSGAGESFHGLIGQKIGPGWNKRVKALIGGTKGCTHINEMLAQMATIAYQTLNSLQSPGAPLPDEQGRPVILDTCFGLASNGPVVEREWPKFYQPDEPEK